MTRFKAEAHTNKTYPNQLDHTFYVETVLCDETAQHALALATAQSPDSDPVDSTAWVLLGRASAQHGPGFTPEAREFQRKWLRNHAGMAEGDKVAQSIRSTTIGNCVQPE